MATLPERYRAAVVLRHIQGLSYQEIAAVLGQPTGTVKSNVHRGVAYLRAALDAAGVSIGTADLAAGESMMSANVNRTRDLASARALHQRLRGLRHAPARAACSVPCSTS